MERLEAVGTLVIGFGLVVGAIATETGIFDGIGVSVALLALAGGMIAVGVGIYRRRSAYSTNHSQPKSFP